MDIRKLSPITYSVFHMVVAVIIFGAPLLLHWFPAAGDLTVSTVVYGFIKFLEQSFAK